MKSSLQKTRSSNWIEHQQTSIWMIVDWDGDFFKQNRELIPGATGGCRVYIPEHLPQGIDISIYSAKIHSKDPQKMISLGFKRNAWKPVQGFGQCDAILFPSTDANGDAFLLVETKYSEQNDSWQSYKDHALKQITDTITQLSNNGCPIGNRNLFGLISCPLLDTIGASAFSPEELMDIYNQHRLSIHMGNSAKFQDTQTISFTD